ncbi:MAG TPA: transposase [Desulfosporosinus sp.]|nr:transposase [Desulfosporosinus sp.]
MARKARIWWPGATYHVMCRGNHQHEIFRDDEDREVYLSVLRQVQSTHPYILHTYCLMTNHVHLQLETKEVKLGAIMKMINMKYAIYFNKKYHFVGQLLQGRYRSEMIDNDRYFLAINRYIHLNPVKANMVERPLEYAWSSCQTYFAELPNLLVEKGKILGHFGEPQILRYQAFLEKGICHTVEDAGTLPERLMLDIGLECEEYIEGVE